MRSKINHYLAEFDLKIDLCRVPTMQQAKQSRWWHSINSCALIWYRYRSALSKCSISWSRLLSESFHMLSLEPRKRTKEESSPLLMSPYWCVNKRQGWPSLAMWCVSLIEKEGKKILKHSRSFPHTCYIMMSDLFYFYSFMSCLLRFFKCKDSSTKVVKMLSFTQQCLHFGNVNDSIQSSYIFS